jgi:C-terminal processing protease CtpA/Prc
MAACGPVLAAGLADVAEPSGAFMGVILAGIDEDLAKKIGSPRGALVTDVVDDSPAAEAGMKDDDVIVALDGESIAGPGHLKDLLSQRKPGDKVTVKVWRDGKSETLTVTLGKSKGISELEHQLQKTIVIKREPKAWLGVRMQELTEQLGEHFGTTKGVLISEVIKDSPAAAAGLAAGDVILKVDGETVESPLDVSKAVADKEAGDKVALVFVRDGKELSKDIELGKTPKEWSRGGPQMFTWSSDEGGTLPSGIDGCLKALKILPRGLAEDVEIETDDDAAQLRDELKKLGEEMKALRVEMESLKQDLDK